MELIIPDDVEVIFACIGSDRSTGDSLGPITGTWLEEMGYNVIGTLDEPLHALNLEKRLNEMRKDYPDHFIVAIDACLGRVDRIGEIVIEKGPLFPGKAVKKKLPPVGDVSIKGIVNVGGFQEYTVLQNTRLSMVWNMSRRIVTICDDIMVERMNKYERKEHTGYAYPFGSSLLQMRLLCSKDRSSRSKRCSNYSTFMQRMQRYFSRRVGN